MYYKSIHQYVISNFVPSTSSPSSHLYASSRSLTEKSIIPPLGLLAAAFPRLRPPPHPAEERRGETKSAPLPPLRSPPSRRRAPTNHQSPSWTETPYARLIMPFDESFPICHAAFTLLNAALQVHLSSRLIGLQTLANHHPAHARNTPSAPRLVVSGVVAQSPCHP